MKDREFKSGSGYDPQKLRTEIPFFDDIDDVVGRRDILNLLHVLSNKINIETITNDKNEKANLDSSNKGDELLSPQDKENRPIKRRTPAKSTKTTEFPTNGGATTQKTKGPCISRSTIRRSRSKKNTITDQIANCRNRSLSANYDRKKN